MKYLSIKWKISLSFVLLALSLLGIYVYIAKQTFETDKIGYIFDSQQQQVGQYAQALGEQISRLFFDSRAVLAGFDREKQTLSPAAASLLNSHELILGLEVSDGRSGEVLVRLEKEPGTLAALSPPQAAKASQIPAVLTLGQNRFVAEVLDARDRTSANLVRVIFALKSPFSEAAKGQILILSHQGAPVFVSDIAAMNESGVKSAIQEAGTKQIEETSIKTIASERFLLSSAPVQLGGFRVISLVKEAVALSALRVLFQRSMFFILFAFFATVLIATLLSVSLTRGIFDLKRAAEKVGAGDFAAVPDVQSNDEIGILAGAFKRMTSEIQKLLLETADKARMESELKTAGLVQENLFPERSSAIAGNLFITGLYRTSTECGGDWWYYFERGRYLYAVVADATGHGTPAALITAAARSLFSFIREQDLSLPEIATLCDDAVYQCSKGKVNMTAFFVRIDTQTGEGSFVNASHDPPFTLKKDKQLDTVSLEYVDCLADSHLGRQKRKWNEQKITIAPGEILMLYTDGLMAVSSPDGKNLEGRRLTKKIESVAGSALTPKHLIENVYQMAYDFGAGQALPDDITLVAIEHRENVQTEALLKRYAAS